jgi:phosphatidate cytidylyltransferase
MRQRSISAVGVVFVLIAPVLIGGPVLAIAFTLLFLIGLREYGEMSVNVGRQAIPTGFAIVPLFALAAVLGAHEEGLLAVCALALGAPILWAMYRANLDRAFVDWSLAVAGTLYIGIPLFAALSVRDLDGTIDVHWLDRVAGAMNIAADPQPRGLAWLLFIILVTWLSDTGAFLVGRSFGKRPLIPRISPKKTIEGLAGGLACAGLTAIVASAVFGLGLNVFVAFVAGMVIAIVGVYGDLAESLLKRQAGIKDSGTLIPGHGGILDRLDALLFTWTAGWFVATCVDRWF